MAESTSLSDSVFAARCARDVCAVLEDAERDVDGMKALLTRLFSKEQEQVLRVIVVVRWIVRKSLFEDVQVLEMVKGVARLMRKNRFKFVWREGAQLVVPDTIIDLYLTLLRVNHKAILGKLMIHYYLNEQAELGDRVLDYLLELGASSTGIMNSLDYCFAQFTGNDMARHLQEKMKHVIVKRPQRLSDSGFHRVRAILSGSHPSAPSSLESSEHLDDTAPLIPG